MNATLQQGGSFISSYYADIIVDSIERLEHTKQL